MLKKKGGIRGAYDGWVFFILQIETACGKYEIQNTKDKMMLIINVLFFI